MEKRMRAVTVVAAALAAVLGGATTAYAAPPRSDHTLATYVLGPGQDPQAVSAALRAGHTADELGLRPADQLATSTQNQQNTFSAHRAAVPADSPPGSDDPTVPPTPLTFENCVSAAPSGTMYVQDRYDVCEWATFYITEYVNREPVGEGWFTGTLVGTAGFGRNSSRTLRFSERLTDFGFTSGFDPQLGINAHAKCLVNLGSTACTTSGDQQSGEFAIWELLGGPSWTYTATLAGGTGTGRDDVSKETLSAMFDLTPPPNFDQNVDPLRFSGFGGRWDNASYIKIGGVSGGAAIFNYLQPMVYHLTGHGVDEVAAHIKTALDNPSSTYPPKPGKVLPGKEATGPLHRLSPDYSLNNAFRYEYNREDATAFCESPRPTGQQCDEYPFASTYEGGAQWLYVDGVTPFDISVRLVNKDQNREAGTDLKDFYKYYRILDPGYTSNFRPTDLDYYYMDIR